MRTIALKLPASRPAHNPAPRPELEYATVDQVRGGLITVLPPGGRVTARRAASCLLAPEPGDRALLSLDGEGQAFVLAVLERAAPGSEQRLVLDGPARLEVPAGALTVTARDGLDLASPSRLSLAAPELSVSADRAEAGLGETRLTGTGLEARLDRITVLARTLDSFVTRCVRRMVSSFRFVQEHDESQAGSARKLVEGTLTVQTGNSVHTAEGQLKLDAEQIHLG